jgi:hypothetical protein
MKRTTLLGILLVAVLACTAALSTPVPAHAIMCCVTGEQTAQYWAKGTTCANAQAAYRALALPEAQATCGGSTLVCAFTLPPCEDWHLEDPANPYKLDGVANYGCKEPCGPLTP